ncbi:hypothetical protein CYY_004623 [Polysphondylium violaceum]|uniref:Peptidase S8/S53 domain-containing protein n=1 Tax=Polysphondylium violaceum TaxID=133409 RepID=A0A8J4V7K9_9MYCE|nr:hypothetical protein CYY_004623 [Polysphondylium violaceum]
MDISKVAQQYNGIGHTRRTILLLSAIVFILCFVIQPSQCTYVSNSNSSNNYDLFDQFLNNINSNSTSKSTTYSSVGNGNSNSNNRKQQQLNKKKIIEKEYIIMFKEYIDQKEHFNIINNIVKDQSNDHHIHWKIVPRNNPASKFPSDFALVSLSIVDEEQHQQQQQESEFKFTSSYKSCSGGRSNGNSNSNDRMDRSNTIFQSFINILKERSSLIKYIIPEKMIVDSLKKWQTVEQQDGNDDNNGDTGSNGDGNVSSADINGNYKGRFHAEIPNISSLDQNRFSTFRTLKSFTPQVTDKFNAQVLWHSNVTGKGTKVAIFDTGLKKNNPNFRNVAQISIWTNDPKEDKDQDLLGHGTFVAGIVASQNDDCPGLAPDTELHIYKVFNSAKVSFTSWFLDAFNHAIMSGINVLNLSIGGPDFMDRPFVEKVWEMSANNIIVVSAIGNDGPLYGTLNNPADQLDVIGVGGIDYDDNIASFSSRGMTTWEIPEGYGRVKPDVVAYAQNVLGLRSSGCKTLSGTSFASPIVTGAISLLVSSVSNKQHVNPASIKQVLIESAERIGRPTFNIFEQGHGKLNLLGAYKQLQNYIPKVSFSPSFIDFTNCPYMWPYCTQPLYHSAMPVIVNATIMNGMSVSSEISKTPVWHPGKNGEHLNVSFSFEKKIWPWVGHMGVFFTVPEKSSNFNGIAEGYIEVVVTSPPPADGSSLLPRVRTLSLPVRIPIIPKPARHRRILWDQFHNLKYPTGFFPKDSLDSGDPFDWNGDHIHTNFKDLYNRLKQLGYYVEVISTPLTCFDPQNYGTLLIVDPEDEFFPAEIKKIEEDVRNYGLNLVVFADWYNTAVMKKIEFDDDNTNQRWYPGTGGSNIPAINDFLSVFGIYLGDSIYDSRDNPVMINEKLLNYSSGSSIIGFPAGGKIIERELYDLTRKLLKQRDVSPTVPILGFYKPPIMVDENESSGSSSSSSSIEDKTMMDQQTSSLSTKDFQNLEINLDNSIQQDQDQQDQQQQQQKQGYSFSDQQQQQQRKSSLPLFKSGQVVVFGDSNCLDEAYRDFGDCNWLLEDILSVLESGNDESVVKYFPDIHHLELPLLPMSKIIQNSVELPERSLSPGSTREMQKFSRVMNPNNIHLLTTCSYHPQSRPEPYFWLDSEKYINISWADRHQVIPSLIIPYTSVKEKVLTTEEIKSQYVIPGYIFICFVVILLIVMFVRTTRSQNGKLPTNIINNSGGGGSSKGLNSPPSSPITVPLLGRFVKPEEEKV